MLSDYSKEEYERTLDIAQAFWRILIARYEEKCPDRELALTIAHIIGAQIGQRSQEQQAEFLFNTTVLTGLICRSIKEGKGKPFSSRNKLN